MAEPPSTAGDADARPDAPLENDPDTNIDEAHQQHADRLKESIYLSFAALAVTLALRSHGHINAGAAIATLAVTLLGTVLAVFTADIIAHLVAHERLMTRAELRHALRSTFGALGSVALPFVFLGIAAITGWDADSALLASAVALVVILVVVAQRAVRRINLRWWQRLIALGAESVLGLVVIGLQVLAHS